MQSKGRTSRDSTPVSTFHLQSHESRKKQKMKPKNSNISFTKAESIQRVHLGRHPYHILRKKKSVIVHRDGDCSSFKPNSQYTNKEDQGRRVVKMQTGAIGNLNKHAPDEERQCEQGRIRKEKEKAD